MSIRAAKRDYAIAQAEALEALAERGGDAYYTPADLIRKASKWRAHAAWIDGMIEKYPSQGA